MRKHAFLLLSHPERPGKFANPLTYAARPNRFRRYGIRLRATAAAGMSGCRKAGQIEDGERSVRVSSGDPADPSLCEYGTRSFPK